MEIKQTEYLLLLYAFPLPSGKWAVDPFPFSDEYCKEKGILKMYCRYSDAPVSTNNILGPRIGDIVALMRGGGRCVEIVEIVEI